jgi:signal transduction histidine kinase
MDIIKKIKQSNTLRWFFLGCGILAVAALTGMNVYSLYALRESTIEAAKENRKIQLEEYTSKIFYRFREPFRGIRDLDMRDLEESLNRSENIPAHFRKVLSDALKDSLFSDIYFTREEHNGCHKPEHPVYVFDKKTGLFKVAEQIPKEVCDGFGISKSRMNTVSLEDYRWNNKGVFDAHRSMTLALINLDQKSIIGHITFLIDRDYLINGILEPELKAKFGKTEESGMVVWLRDWMHDDILISSNPDYPFSRDHIDMRQRFPDLLDNWVLHVSFLESPVVAATQASLNRNLIVLGFAVFVLFGALAFMFINAQKEREFALRQADFLANVTHELKTPLAVMQAAGENISDGRVTDGERLKSYGNHIYAEAIRLRKMIDKLLDVAKVDSGQTMVNQAPVNLDKFLTDYYKTHKEYVKNRGHSLLIEDVPVTPMVMADSNHLETILNNLVENSMKYSPNGNEIRLSVSVDKSAVSFTIKDQGIGIPKKAQKNIFNKFYRVESADTANTKGHGLGLSIVKNLTELNGGKITVNSEPGKGSEFTVTFPSLLTQPDGSNNEVLLPSGRKSKRLEENTYVG